MSSKIALVLFLFLSPALAWPQTAVPDQRSGPAQEQLTQQTESTENSASQVETSIESESQTAAATPQLVPDRAGQKTETFGGKQTQRMFWIVPNFAAVSADTQLPPLSVREKFVLATQGAWTIRHSFGQDFSPTRAWL